MMPHFSQAQAMYYHNYQQFSHLYMYVQPFYYETVEASYIQLSFNNIHPCTSAQESNVTIDIPQTTMCFPWTGIVEETNLHTISIQAINGINLTIDCSIIYRKSSITVTVTNVQLSTTGITCPTSVDILKAIKGVYSTLELVVYDNMTYEVQRRMSVFVQAKTHINITDMTSCLYYNIIYVSDSTNSLIHKLDPFGSSSQLMLKAQPNCLSVTKTHTLLVGCANSTILELTTDGQLIRELSLTGMSNPRRIIYLEQDRYLVMGNEPSDASRGVQSALFVVGMDARDTPLNGSAEPGY